MRIERPGAACRVMCRGDRREDIVHDEDLEQGSRSAPERLGPAARSRRETTLRIRDLPERLQLGSWEIARTRRYNLKPREKRPGTMGDGFPGVNPDSCLLLIHNWQLLKQRARLFVTIIHHASERVAQPKDQLPTFHLHSNNLAQPVATIGSARAFVTLDQPHQSIGIALLNDFASKTVAFWQR